MSFCDLCGSFLDDDNESVDCVACGEWGCVACFLPSSDGWLCPECVEGGKA